MKSKQTLMYVILSFTSMMWVLGGCHRNNMAGNDQILAEADSLLQSNNPDSALQVLSAIDGAGLGSAGDRAYHALLLTQAQYRCYADITSDSTINVALDYYKRHVAGEQEKLTRSYIYKGAVEEVLNKPEDAMTLYKQAVGVAEDDDHFNLGYAKMRIGSLYRDHLTADYPYIHYFKEALKHFEQVPDSFYITNCLSSIGNCYCALEKKDSALVYLERAASLAKTLGLKGVAQINQVYLADLKMHSSSHQEIEESKSIALSLLQDKDFPHDRREHTVLIAAFTLGKLNKPDSARLLLSQVDQAVLNDGLRVLYYNCMAEVARCHHDLDQYQYHYQQADNLADSLLLNGQQLLLRDVEAKYDNEVLRYERLKYKTKWQLLLTLSLLATSLLGIVLLLISRKSSQRKRQITANENTIERLQNDTTQLALQLANNQAMNEGLKTTIRHQIETFTQLVESHYTQFTKHPKKFSALFQRAYDVNQPDQSFWIGIRSYADSAYNGIITCTLEKHPLVNENDARFMSLCCCHLPTTVIMVCMGYNDVHSVYNKKHRIEVKLGDNQRFDDYILSFENRQQDGISEA